MERFSYFILFLFLNFIARFFLFISPLNCEEAFPLGERIIDTGIKWVTHLFIQQIGLSDVKLVSHYHTFVMVVDKIFSSKFNTLTTNSGIHTHTQTHFVTVIRLKNYFTLTRTHQMHTARYAHRILFHSWNLKIDTEIKQVCWSTVWGTWICSWPSPETNCMRSVEFKLILF